MKRDFSTEDIHPRTLAGMKAGDTVVILDAYGGYHERVAVTGVTRGMDFMVVWVAKPGEYAAARQEGRDPDMVPWPAEDVWLPEEPMDGRPCIGKPLAETAVVEGVSYYRIPWGPPPDLNDDREFLGGISPERLAAIRERWATWPEGFAANCRDCATPQGALHHPGCDTERCPRCLGQAISCGCKWEGDTADPEDDGQRAPESPYARRAQ
jgi:hypothetical protein